MGLFAKYSVLSVKQAGSPFDESAKQEIDTKSYDYIIVGGGTAGCCLASRLSENPLVSVLVLERGPVHDAWYSRIPLISGDLTSPATPIVRSPSMPVAAAEGNILEVVHAEALGGGSGVNAMLVTRGAVADFNRWAELGHPSWDYATMQPFLTKSENALSHNSARREYSGPSVHEAASALPYEIQRNVQKAAVALGFKDVKHFNSPDIPIDVCAIMDEAIDAKLRRVSSYHAFLPLEVAEDRHQRLKICTKAVGTRIELDSGVAVGVVFESSNKSIPGTFYARARKEIIVCCGAIGSPQLLLLSGIGPKEALEPHGISSVINLPGVGAHLKDHIGLPIMYEVPLRDTLHHSEISAWKGMLEFGKYMLGFKGIMGSTVSPMSIFAHSTHLDDTSAVALDSLPSAALDGNRPDIEIMTVAHYCSQRTLPGPTDSKLEIGVFSFLLGALQPKSIGTVCLASSDPHARPNVDLGFLTDAEDYVPLRKGIKLALRLAEKVAAQGYPIKNYQVPLSEKDGDLDQFIRSHIRTCYHYASTCRMARLEDGGVVDDDLQVHGVRGLRVCDASVFPCIPSAHTMIPVIAVAERCAEIIKQANGSS
ncbi:alcohol oxidase [Mycena polygramma]|nr:alcohol oxidase [Mycena polygramma]